jgi:SH3-like domain-containing protein
MYVFPIFFANEPIPKKNDKTQNKKNDKKQEIIFRFASLRSNKINLHVGPGKEYPVDFQYLRQYMPVEIIAEFDLWRKIRDHEGNTGWVHKGLLTGRRYAMTIKKNWPLLKEPSGKVIIDVEPGVVCKLKECQGTWCRVEIHSNEGRFRGWLAREGLYGVYPNETKF